MMSRLTGLLLAVLLVAGVGKADAQEPQEEWMKFLEGEWTYKWPAVKVGDVELPEVEQEVKSTRAAKRNALVTRGTSDDTEWVSLIGWRPDTKTLVFTRYGSSGGYWQSEFGNVARNEISGQTVGALPDGRPVKGTVAVKRVDNNTFETHVDVETADGQKLATVGTAIRKKAAEPK